jgi:hypothetical protein
MIINLKIKNMKNDFTQITSLEEALKRVDEATRNDFNKSLEGYNTPDEIAYKQKKLIAKAIRGDWEPDWVDYNQKKWFPIFYMVSSGSGFDFSNSVCHFGYSFTSVGSRLCFPNEEMSDHFGKQFIEIHKKHLL